MTALTGTRVSIMQKMIHQDFVNDFSDPARFGGGPSAIAKRAVAFTALHEGLVAFMANISPKASEFIKEKDTLIQHVKKAVPDENRFPEFHLRLNAIAAALYGVQTSSPGGHSVLQKVAIQSILSLESAQNWESVKGDSA